MRPLSLLGTPWGRGVGEGIGLSGHKNEFKSGVRIGNWVEEQFGAESAGVGDTLKVRCCYRARSLLRRFSISCASCQPRHLSRPPMSRLRRPS